MNDLFILPVPGRLVRHPLTGEPVPPEGVTVPASPYWLRRLQDGDVLLKRPVQPPEGEPDGDQL